MTTPAGLYALWAWLFVALGLAGSVLGPALPALRADFGISLATSGLLFTLQAAGYLAGVLLAGPLADARGRKLVCGVAAALLAGGMALAAAAPTWPVLLAGMVMAGTGFAFVDVGANAAIADAVAGASRRAAVMNLLHGAFPLGTLAGPALLALAWGVGLDWRAAFLMTAFAAGASLLGFAIPTLAWPDTRGTAEARAQICPGPGPAHAPVAAAAAGIHAEGPPGPEAAASDAAAAYEAPRKGMFQLLRETHLRSLAAIQALYIAVEVAIAGWLATYLIEAFGTDESAGALATAGYWGGFLVGRAAAAYLTHRFEPHRVLLWLLMAALAAAGTGVVAPLPVPSAVAWALTGAAISGIFPTVMALALEGRRGDTGAAAALVTAAAATGGLIWPWLVGAVAEATNLRVAMATAALPILFMLLIARAAPIRLGVAVGGLAAGAATVTASAAGIRPRQAPTTPQQPL